MELHTENLPRLWSMGEGSGLCVRFLEDPSPAALILTLCGLGEHQSQVPYQVKGWGLHYTSGTEG
jgi:hypothetical protein